VKSTAYVSTALINELNYFNLTIVIFYCKVFLSSGPWTGV